MERVGIIGGTFDPIHYGHLLLAEQAREGGQLNRVIFLPTKASPFKQNSMDTASNVRYEMVELAIADNPMFQISDFELRGPDISYTIRTLEGLSQELGNEVLLHFICGTDAFLTIESWFEAERILQNFPIIVGARPNVKIQEMQELKKRLERNHQAHIVIVDMPKVDISSTDIKNRLKEGNSIAYLVPKVVESYIRERGVYRELV